MNESMCKADLHVHSKYSKRPSQWILRKLGASESYTDPLELYELAKARGMDLVTITDHNTLAGSLEIAHLENTFVSEEITTYFPEDGCKLHVLAYNITERQHEEISRLRENVFELTAYLVRQQIVHALAHPMYAVNDRLTLEHFEQTLLLFKHFELNGARNSEQNEVLAGILNNLTQPDLEDLAEKHGLDPVIPEPWNKNLVGGSDDHASLNVAGTYTEVDGVDGVDDFLSAVAEGRTRVRGQAASPKHLAHTIYSVAYQFYRSKFSLERFTEKDAVLKFVDRVLIPVRDRGYDEQDRKEDEAEPSEKPSFRLKATPRTMQALLKKEARKIIRNDADMLGLVGAGEMGAGDVTDLWFRFVDRISEKVLRQSADTILDNISGANLFDIFHTIGSVGSLYTMLVPYFVGYTHFTKDRLHASTWGDRLAGKRQPSRSARLKIAHFTDTFHDVNGVAKTLQMQLEIAQKNDKQLEMITCGPEADAHGITNFDPIGTFEMPEYDLLKLYYPPLLKMLDYCYEKRFTHIHAATPGPIGLAALAISRILHLPLYGTYHTALPQYVTQLTDDSSMEELVWKFMIWFYGQTDVVYVPSRATGEELAEKGIPQEKIKFYPRGIDIERFHPSKANGFYNRYDLRDEELKLLYVGRVSREKNLPELAEAYRKLTCMRTGIRLVIVGEGPYLEEMKQALNGLPVTFTGFLGGEDLPQAYASSDVFVFPSTTDTFGNVVLEAQASGIPVVVTDQGGPQENLIPGRTGYIATGGDPEAFLNAVLPLIDNPKLLKKMKRNARKYTQNRSFEAAYLRLWESYRNCDPLRSADHPDWARAGA
jgi:glycosyltransferase involved in cell wall biosynthesis